MWSPKCNGPNPEQEKQCATKAEAYELLAKFHAMSARDQRVFVALFNALCEEDESEHFRSEIDAARLR